ncbi:unnamed protein product [Nippostrongylus brasiliensis]|uniref:Gag_p10 domain-containing protein n=1 Tax=Nippostrongylus brasiliensis TaxID=27835 RepID=A0A0N4Y3Q0_NIPBR|nr:unnamed protein product [Nippostrongylus brasiliensis]
MALHFHKIPIINSASTLKNLVTRYTGYTARVEYSSVDEENYEKCKATTALLQSSINQIKEGRERLEKLYSEVREEYKNCKNKSDKKDLLVEIEEIENESQVHKELASADELIFMLTARFDESKCTRDTMSVKLGYVSHRSLILQNSSENVENQGDEDENQPDESQNGESNPSQTATTSAVISSGNDARHFRSIKPPQATLPKFYGNAEEFPEYWAIFETLVHNSRELDVMEKILLLKESLKGKAQASIKGIRLLPENYQWIIRTLQENYCNQPTNRSQVVQKLVNLKPASNFSDSCSAVFDQIQILINQYPPATMCGKPATQCGAKPFWPNFLMK